MNAIVSSAKVKELPITRRPRVEVGTLGQGKKVSISSITIRSSNRKGEFFGEYGTEVEGNIAIKTGSLKMKCHDWKWSICARCNGKLCTRIPNSFVHNRSMNLAIKRFITGHIWSTKHRSTVFD